MRRSTKKGFTLAELLIVIAIIAILIAIMFPVFGAQLDKARAAAELANVRAAYSEAVANAMLGEGTDLTIAEGNEIEVAIADLQSALSYDETVVTVTSGTGTTKGSVTVEYNGYTGTFETDADVTFDVADGTEITK